MPRCRYDILCHLVDNIVGGGHELRHALGLPDSQDTPIEPGETSEYHDTPIVSVGAQIYAYLVFV